MILKIGGFATFINLRKGLIEIQVPSFWATSEIITFSFSANLHLAKVWKWEGAEQEA